MVSVKPLELAGRTFGKWSVIRKVPNTNPVKWLCVCQCGNEKEVFGTNLVRGKTTSCGCHRKEFLSITRRTHGQRKSRLYTIWSKMKERCYNPNVKSFQHYGARGIRVCDEWRKDFETFYEWAMSNGYTDDLTIERNDVNGPYAPQNCRWATMLEQGRNKTNNLFLTVHGVTKTLSEWSEETGIDRRTIQSRINYGWHENDLTKPVRR